MPWRTICGMESLRVPIVRLASADLPLPGYFSAHAAGMDLSASLTEAQVLGPGEFQLIPCGVAIAIPPGYEGQIRPRSGLASRHGVTVLNAPGTIDSDYRGELQVLLINHGKTPFSVLPGMRVAQLVMASVTRVTWDTTDTLPTTGRGQGGFGHTGE
jgi:dUTP pyrophosphatase